MAYHQRHGGSGYLWQGRFRSVLVQKAGYLGRLGQYIERNPLAAGVRAVTEASDYAWSSARAYVLGATDPLVTVGAHPEWAGMGLTDPARRACYRRNLQEAREAAAEARLFDGGAGLVVGDADFCAQARQQVGRLTARPRGRRRTVPPATHGSV